jgi:NADPH:quinone reductase-like Zn-dependent oxidoreductase
MVEMMRRWEMSAVGRERLSLRDVPIPEPGRGEVLVKVSAVALNYRDKLAIDRGFGISSKFPFTPGSDLAGLVVAAAADANRFKVGERVISTFMPEWMDGGGLSEIGAAQACLGGDYPGVLAEYVCFPEHWFVRAPANLDDEEACTLPVAGLTAWTALTEGGGLRPGDVVVIHGTGGVALFGLQIAKAHNAKVIVITSSADKIARVRAMGADHAIDRYKEKWLEAIRRLTENRGANQVLETVGGANLGRSLNALAHQGRISVVGVLGGFDLSAPFGPLITKGATIRGVRVGHRRAMEGFVRAVEQTKLRPVIDGRYALSDLEAALSHLDSGPFGKVVVTIAGRNSQRLMHMNRPDGSLQESSSSPCKLEPTKRRSVLRVRRAPFLPLPP